MSDVLVLKRFNSDWRMITLDHFMCLLIAIILDISGAWSVNINSLLLANNPASMGLGTDLLESLLDGVRMALEQCQEQFKWDAWNCPKSSFSRRGWQTSTREAAFVMAVTAAGITHSVTKSCSKGDLDNCGCDLSLPGHSGQDEGWLWGGCSDLVTHGENVTVKLMESTEPSKMDWRTLVNLHNNAVGRGAVRASLQRRCKCHGLSGSCTTKTCWMQVSNFQDIAKDLRRKYDKAVRVSFEPRRRNLVLGNSAVGSSGNLISEYNTQQLVYMEESPDYCLENNSTGWPGTRGRSCSKPVGDSVTPEEKRSCRNLCHGCGYRVLRNRRYVTKHCNCSFKWCCEVTCDTCTTAVEEHYCE